MKNSEAFLRTVIVYVRVYSKESLNIHSLDEQEKAILDFTIKNGYRVLEVFRETNVSAKSFDRPAFKKMIEYIKANPWKVKFLIVMDHTRLSTDKSGLKNFRRFLKVHGIKQISVVDSMLRKRYR